jgi:Protein of unknown function (DUF4242)
MPGVRSVLTMITPRLRDPGDSSRVFLVERYLPPAQAGELAASVARVVTLCALSATSASGSPVRYLHSAYLPGEDTCFCLFQAATADAVRALNDEAGFALDRITAAILLYPASSPTAASDESRQP